MASITKRGNSYQILVPRGFDMNGKKLWESITWTPPVGLTPNQEGEALLKAVADFENNNNSSINSSRPKGGGDEIVEKLKQIEQGQQQMIQLLSSIYSILKEKEYIGGKQEQSPSSTAFMLRPYYINWNEIPQIMGTKDISKLLILSESRSREIMHRDDFPLIKIREGLTQLRVDKDNFKTWLLGMGKDEQDAISNIKRRYK